jgi:hypothetical protein
MSRERLARVPAAALLVLIVGLAFHNLVMSLLYQAGVRGTALDVVAAWKEAVLLAGLAAAVLVLKARPGLVWADRAAAVFTALVVLYWVLPQSWLGGGATERGELLALRHHLLPVAAYALGRLLPPAMAGWRRLVVALLAVGATVAAWGLIDVVGVPLDVWRDSGVPGWFRDQLGLRSECLELPENWIFNTGDETNPVRRMTSTFLSPLATSYALVVVLLLLAARRRWDRVAGLIGAVALAGLLWTHTRAAFVALALGLVVLAVVHRRLWPVIAAAAWIAIAIGFVKAFPTIGPSTSYTEQELVCLRDTAAEKGSTSGDALTADDASLRSHWRSLRLGVETVIRHPQGFGLGNAGVAASRTGVEIRAGESTYTELGVEAGLAGALAFVGWLAALLLALLRRTAWLTAAVVAVAALGLQTDVIGVHWLAVTVFGLAGAAINRSAAPAPEETSLTPARPRGQRHPSSQ